MKKLLITIAALGLVSCEPLTESSFLFYNGSSKSVEVTGSLIFYNTESSLVLKPGATSVGRQWTQRGKIISIIQPSEILGKDVQIINIDGDTITKDYQKEDNWTWEVNSNSRVTTQSYTFYMSDDDF